MRWCSGLALGVLIAVTAGRTQEPPRDEVLRAELQRLQGTWQVESWEEGGKPLPAADLKDRTVFFGANAFILKRGGKLVQAGVVQLDPSKDPKTFNAIVREGERKDTVMLGVYEFGDGTLKLCFDPEGQARPTGFKPAAKGGAVLAVLRKPKPPADEQLEIVGKYSSELVEPDGKKLITEAEIERRGDAYLVTYRKDGKLLFVGTALRKGDTLSMTWISSGQAGVSVYKIEKGKKGPHLTGEFTTLTGLGVVGKELLTPYRRVD
jgi:uncharacterized protein (TIGR03067 family)